MMYVIGSQSISLDGERWTGTRTRTGTRRGRTRPACVFVCRPLCLLRGLAAHRGVLEARSTQYVLRTVRVIDCARPGKFFRG